MGKRAREQWSMPETNDRLPDFRKELGHLLNRHSREYGSNTPDFILTDYLIHCLMAFDQAVTARQKWWGHENPWKQVMDGSPLNPLAEDPVTENPEGTP